jgi:hypothetical protein
MHPRRKTGETVRRGQAPSSSCLPKIADGFPPRARVPILFAQHTRTLPCRVDAGSFASGPRSSARRFPVRLSRRAALHPAPPQLLLYPAAMVDRPRRHFYHLPSRRRSSSLVSVRRRNNHATVRRIVRKKKNQTGNG